MPQSLKQSLPETVTLVGGPCDGRVVNFMGAYCVRHVASCSLDPPPWDEAHYVWEELESGEIVGKFQGLYHNNRRINLFSDGEGI